MSKNNIRSIRFTDELAELIDRQIGNNFTEKFENLITKCVWERPQREEEIQHLDEEIKMKREELMRLRIMTHQIRTNLDNITKNTALLEASIDAAISKIK